MPGLNQLKQFVNDIKNIGDEVKIRAQRGEKPAVVPLPEGIPEDDDSQDFVLGLPEQKNENQSEDSQSADTEELSSADDFEIDLNAQDTGEGLPPDLDALLNGVAGGTNEVPDLSDFDDSPAVQPEPEETPLEDLDLDALLKPSEPAEEDSQAAAEEENNLEKPKEAVDLSDVGDLASIEDLEEIPSLDDGGLSDSENPALVSLEEESAENEEKADAASSVEKDESAEIDKDESVSDNQLLPSMDDEFAFDGSAIDLNEDVPEDIAEADGAMPFDEQSEALDKDNSEESVQEISADGDSASETPSMQDLFSTEDLDAPADFSSSEESQGFDLPDFDNPQEMNSQEDSPVEAQGLEDDTAANAILKENELPVDAAMDVPGEDFSGAMDEMGDVGEIDFGTSTNAAEEFPVTSAPVEQADDDFLLDDDNFEIPGFSDIETANFDKKGRPKVDTVDFSKAGTGKPKNTLTDEEYGRFRDNLSEYPLNLRLAVEDLIVKNEFTDDAVFEVVEKILKRVSARQLATHLEKMLDISIDVPRDYERRSVAQYEAYKQSFQYQLKNRIIPGGIAGIVFVVLCTLLFQAGKIFIYNPTMAKIIYKQGYTLLENNEYPQSEERFIAATRYKPIKKWFFKYAHGYRSHKQYERAGQMYRNILGVFDHDKQAGIEWAEMELYDRSNFERSEEIVRREILDYHINDPDALLLLGDVFLEWGEIDSQKYEDAREHYSNLIQLYGATNIYMARMMRYFIRTDKLRNVLELKNRFYPDKKSLIAQDWVELSGYLLDKLYGPLSRSDEYLRSQIEDVRAMLEIAEKADPSIPAAHYNMARYFIRNNNFESARRELKTALDCFDKIEFRNKKNCYQEIDTCRLLGELYAETREYLKAQEVYTRGINLYQSENESTGFEGDKNTGLLYADMGDIEYFVSGDMDAALKNYENSILNKNDTASLNYRIGAIRYNNQEYDKALASFIKAFETQSSDINLLLSLGNVLSLRGDNFASQGYYSHLLSLLDTEKARHLMLFPQEKEDDNKLVEMYLKVNNNLGVTLYKIARQTGDSRKNAESLVRLSDSIRAWDALTRNPVSMVRLGGSNLALQNSKYITSSKAEYEPAIYTDIPKTLVDEKVLQ